MNASKNVVQSVPAVVSCMELLQEANPEMDEWQYKKNVIYIFLDSKNMAQLL